MMDCMGLLKPFLESSKETYQFTNVDLSDEEDLSFEIGGGCCYFEQEMAEQKVKVAKRLVI